MGTRPGRSCPSEAWRVSDSYLNLLRAPGVARVMASQLVARFPTGMLALGILIHIETVFGSYGAAGVVLAAMSVGQALAGPVTSRMMGRFGARRVLVVTTVLCAGSMAVVALAPMQLWGFVVFALLTGLSSPPVQPAVRTIYPRLVDVGKLPRLFSLDASAQEIIWVAGPLVITVVSREISPVVGLLVCVAVTLAGGAWFITSKELGTVRIARSETRLGAVLLKPGVMLATVTGLLLIGAGAAVEVGVVARFGEGGLQAGVVLALAAVASLAGGLTLGHLPLTDWTLTRRLAVVAVGTFLAIYVSGVWWTGLAMVVFGFGIAPALAVMYTMVSDSTDFSESAEAYGWIGTGQLVGAAVGSAIAGFMIDANGPAGGFAVAAVVAALAVVAAALLRHARPKRTGADLLADAVSEG
ncbi:MFS transporter [Tessaracoccus rhinocerotis]|uniref:MFS transporter n=1 Tax=Tessaracoccus rhinocerotis TaxID=1689449 RepID=A0A553K0Z3_9ACTN|nr:MFS transporter [Tessaracoccus rhinocerotis]